MHPVNNGKICVSVCAETADEMINKIRRAEQFADVIEVRFDCLRNEQAAILRSIISDLKIGTPLLATFRSRKQGGMSDAPPGERRAFLSGDMAAFQSIDLEEDIAYIAFSGKRIISFHDLAGVPDDLGAIWQRHAATDADIVKIVVTANDITDTIAVWRLLERANTSKGIIPIAMGEAGKWTRVLGLAHGAAMTYASLDSATATAPGQITASEMIDVYRVKELDRETRVYGVLGDPIAQSVSPYMHNAAFAATGINAVFIPFLVKNIGQFIERMVRPESREVELNFGGFSVTMPHKQAIMPFLDNVDETAAAVGAVNTVTIADGKMTGRNTDVHGFITPLTERFGDVKGARVAVFGAGGAARAVVYGLKTAGADVTIFARDTRKAGELGTRFGVEVLGLPYSPSDFDVLVNATPLGMKGDRENDSILSAEKIAGAKFVYDLVTKASETPLLANAREARVDGIGGLEMLIAQGMRQFEFWTGQAAPAEIMRAALKAKMSL